MTATSKQTIPEVTHHFADVNGTRLHYVAAGASGSPVLLVHGFPESWWCFHKLIPLLAAKHRVFAVDLRGFGDSSRSADGKFDSQASAADLHKLVEKLETGPVHLTGQDISGGAVFRFAAKHPEDVLSLTAIEMGLAGFGLEKLADVTHGGAWYIGALAAPGIPEMLLVGREKEFLGDYAFPAMSLVKDAVTDEDLAEFTRVFARPDGWRGAIGLYQSMLKEGEDLQALAKHAPLKMPVLAVGGLGGSFTQGTMAQVAKGEVRSVVLKGVGHYVAMEAPDKLCNAMLDFLDSVDRV